LIPPFFYLLLYLIIPAGISPKVSLETKQLPRKLRCCSFKKVQKQILFVARLKNQCCNESEALRTLGT
jgi:hypothetical protein